MDQKKILVVDDEPIGRQLLQAVLLPEGYDVILAENGMDAIEKMKSTLPDIVLLDVMMPGMDGYETMRRIKGDLDIKHIPVIFITALDDRDSRIRGLESGANDYISKPFDRIEILTKIKNLISKTQVEKVVTETSVQNQLFDSKSLSKIIDQIYNFGNHKNKFPGSINIASSGSSLTAMFTGWYAKLASAELHCFFGPITPNDMSGIGNILITCWLNTFLYEPIAKPSETCSYINTKMQSSDLLVGENRKWWFLIFMKNSSGDWQVSGFNQTLFSPVKLDDSKSNTIKLKADQIENIQKGSVLYFFSSELSTKIVEYEIINTIQQSDSIELTHQFLSNRGNFANTFTLRVVL